MLQEWEAKNTNCRRTGGEIVWERSNTVVGLASCRVSIIEDIQKLTWHGCEQPDTTWKLTLSWAWGRCHVKVLSKKTYYMVTYRSHLKYFANDMELLDISLLNIYKYFFFYFFMLSLLYIFIEIFQNTCCTYIYFTNCGIVVVGKNFELQSKITCIFL